MNREKHKKIMYSPKNVGNNSLENWKTLLINTRREL